MKNIRYVVKMSKQKYTCLECGWHCVGDKKIWKAKNPFDYGELWACPKCREQSIVEACDYPHCFLPSTSGTPLNGKVLFGKKYLRLCYKHYILLEKEGKLG